MDICIEFKTDRGVSHQNWQRRNCWTEKGVSTELRRIKHFARVPKQRGLQQRARHKSKGPNLLRLKFVLEVLARVDNWPKKLSARQETRNEVPRDDATPSHLEIWVDRTAKHDAQVKTNFKKKSHRMTAFKRVTVQLLGRWSFAPNANFWNCIPRLLQSWTGKKSCSHDLRTASGQSWKFTNCYTLKEGGQIF